MILMLKILSINYLWEMTETIRFVASADKYLIFQMERKIRKEAGKRAN